MKLIAALSNTRIDISVYEDENGAAHAVRSRPHPLSWQMVHNPSLGRAMTATEFAKFNRIPLV